MTKEIYQIKSEKDLAIVRNRVRENAKSIGMNILNQTKLMTAASELMRNMLNYAGGGQVSMHIIDNNLGLQLMFEDKGPGIKDINLAMEDGYSTAKSLGVGLPGARRLVDKFEIETSANGTRITVLKWNHG